MEYINMVVLGTRPRHTYECPYINIGVYYHHVIMCTVQYIQLRPLENILA